MALLKNANVKAQSVQSKRAEFVNHAGFVFDHLAVKHWDASYGYLSGQAGIAY